MTSHKLTITFESALHHGSGFGISGLVDRAILRDSAGIPYLAGSAIKGKLRHAMLRVLLSMDEESCHTGDGSAVCSGPAVCGLCRLFGSPRKQGALYFSDARLAGETADLMAALARLPQSSGLYRDSAIRARTSMDRKLGTARAGLLFSTEVLPESLVFESAIRLDAGAGEGSIDWLKKACRVITHFGADSARGLGKCRLEIE